MFRAAHHLKHVEPSMNFGIINSITELHLAGISTEEHTDLLQCNYCVEHRELPLKLQSVLVWFIESQATSN